MTHSPTNVPAVTGRWFMWGILALTCITYGAFAIAASMGLVETDKTRALPLAFSIHAASGGIALITGCLQFNPAIRSRWVRLHRWVGRTYALGVSVAGISAVLNALAFDVSPLARISFVLLGAAWLGTTLAGFAAIRRGNPTGHREWMTRSFSLSLFFVSFSIWVPVFEGFDHPHAYALAVTLSWIPNLVLAEAWLQRTRRSAPIPR